MQDREIAKAFQRALTKQGFKWKLGFKCNKAEVEGDTVKLHVEAAKDGKQETLEANIVLVAAGECLLGGALLRGLADGGAGHGNDKAQQVC